MKKFPLMVLTILLPALMLANAILDKSFSRSLYAPNIIKIQLSEKAIQSTDLPQGLYAESSAFGLTELDNIKSRFGSGKVIRAHIRLKDAEYERKHGVARWFLVKFTNNIDVPAAIKAFKASALIEQATPEYYAYTQAIPNDPYYPNNWGHNNTAQLPVYQGGSHSGPGVGTIGFDSNAQAAWDYPQGYGSAAIIIAIIDTGVDTAHPDLRLVTGYDYGDNDANPMDDSSDPGHGTACSGIAAGRGNNSLGIAGMAPGCSVMPLKIASSDGSLGFTAIENALYHCGDNNVDVASMSFGASMSPGDSPSTDTALAYAYSHGVAMFAATANANTSTIDYPSNHVNVISVGAASPSGQRKSTTSSDGETWWGSNYGSTTQDANTAVDIMAPTILPATDITGTGNGYNTSSDYYMWFNGTSCATPYAAGMAALVLSHTPSLTPDQLRTVITSTCTDMTSDGGAGWDRYTGYGMVNAEAALASLIPGMPTCQITSPASGTTFNLGNVITVNVTATDPTTRNIVDVKFYLDGSATPSYTDNSAPYSWAWNTAGTTNGSHTITATATDNESNAVSDMISVTVIAPADEGFESGNFSAFDWNNSSAVPWIVQSIDKFSGTYAAKSGAITDNGSTTLSLPMTVSSSGNISFYYKVSSETNWDFLKFYIDGLEQGSWSGTAGWAEASYPVSSGNRVFSWTYSKDSSVSSGSDCAWLDHLIFPPHGTYFAPPQNLSAAAGNGTVGLSWQAPASGSPSSYKIFRNSALLTSLTGTNYTDNAVVNGTLYSYYVTAVYSSPAGESEPSNTVTATPGTVIVNDYVIGTGTLTTGTNVACPINVYYKSLHGQSVYTAAELNAAGVTGPCNITKVGFYVDGLPTLAMPNYVIRMGHTTATNVANWISTGLTTVWTTASYQPTTTGWNQLTLSTPFAWDGTSNILIDTAFGDIGAWDQSGMVQYTNVTSGYRFAQSDYNDQTNVFSGGSTSFYRPNIKITTSYVPPAPAIEVNPASQAFGTVRINTTSSNTFQISNPGSALLTGNISTPTGYSVALGRAESSGEAGFGVASLSKSSSRNTLAYSIPAGGSSIFTVTFAPIAVQPYNGSITITHNAGGANRTVALTGQGGKSTIFLNSSAFNTFLTPGGTANQELIVNNTGNMSLSYSLTINGTVPWLTLNGGTTVSNTIAVGGAAQFVTIGYNAAGLAPGNYNATVSGTSDDPNSSTFTISVSLTVNTPIVITAPAGGATWQSGEMRQITWNYGGHASNVILLYSTNNGSTWTQIAVAGVVQGTNSYIWTVPYIPSTLCRIRVRDNIAPNVQVDSNQFSIVTPIISVNQTSMNFGLQQINTTATANFTITNTGTATLNGNISTPAGYSVAVARGESEELGLGNGNNTRNTLPYSLFPGGNRTFTVTFAPTAVQAYNGNITITHNASGTNRTIALSGEGGTPSMGLSAISFNATLALDASSSQTLTISNSGNMELSYSLNDSDTVPWLSLNGGDAVSSTIAAGAAAQDVSIGFNTTGLAIGTYNATINGTSNDPNLATFGIAVSMEVFDPNHAPEIDLPATFEIARNGELTVDFSGYVSDVDNDPLSLSYVASDHISASINGLSVTISPVGDWTGSELLSFTVHDGSAEATDLVTVVVSNTAPIISLPDSFNFDRNGSLAVDFEPYVSDANGDMLSLSYSGNVGVNISVVGSVVTFTNDPAFAGSEVITFTISDGTDTGVDAATIYVENHAPVLDPPASFTLDQNGSLTVDFGIYYSDPDGDVLTVGYNGNLNVNVEINGTSVTFTPAVDWYGEEPITFTVNDGYLSDAATVVIHVDQVISSLDTPVLSISQSAGSTLLQWEAVPYANEYWIFRGEEPYGTYNQIGTTSNLQFTDPDGLPKAFYQVKAVIIPLGK